MQASTDISQIRERVDAHFDQAIEELCALVRIPSVAFPGYDPQQVRASAEAVAALITDVGISDVQILSVDTAQAQGAPAVLARKPAAPGKATIMLYAHHDVQPVSQQQPWDTEAFAPTKMNGRLYGRGAADDKAGVIAHITALKTLLELRGDDFGLGVTLFIEGEEEAGSPTFRAFLDKYRDELAADVIVIADSANWAVGEPALTTGLRGLVDATVELSVMEHSVHSGMFGGPILDAYTLAARLISTFHDAAGSVAIQGLVSGEQPEVELAEEQFRSDSSVLDSVELAGTGSLTSRLWSKPALSIIGFDAPEVQQASNTLSANTRFKVSVRLAPGQDPAAAMSALEAHVLEHAPFGAKVTFIPGEQGMAFEADPTQAATQSALWAMEQAWGVPAKKIGLGGSIPFIADLLQVYPQAQILVTGVEDPDSRAHSANESLHLEDFRRSILSEALLLAQLDEQGLE